MRPAALSTLSSGPSLVAAAVSTFAHLSLLGLLLVGSSTPSAPPAAHLAVEVVSLPAGAPGSAPRRAAAAAADAPATEVALTAPVAMAQPETALFEIEQVAAAPKMTPLPVETPTTAAARPAAAVPAEPAPPDPESMNAEPAAAEAVTAETVAERSPPLPPRRPMPPVPAAASADMPAAAKPATLQPALPAAARSAPRNAAQGDGEVGEAVAASAPGGPSRGAELRPGGNPAPSYPQEARRRGQEGRVVLRVTISPVGEARSVRVLQSSGYERLDRAAREAVARWRFEPARRAGRPVEGLLDVPVVFRLEQS